MWEKEEDLENAKTIVVEFKKKLSIEVRRQKNRYSGEVRF